MAELWTAKTPPAATLPIYNPVGVAATFSETDYLKLHYRRNKKAVIKYERVVLMLRVNSLNS